jgi:hypothetical protein
MTATDGGSESSRVFALIERETDRSIIETFHAELGTDPQPNLLGYLMTLGYDEATVITNDFYKVRAGGVSKNSFVILRPGALEIGEGADTWSQRPHLILARVLEGATTPLAQEVSRTYFELHKSHMPEIDVFTKAELQWSAMKVAILGTFYDDVGGRAIGFGGDVETFWSPHLYTVHAATSRMLSVLVNAFVTSPNRSAIGSLRFTETRLSPPTEPIDVLVAPEDFIGSRTALFGKTRMGKSNTVKIIAQMILNTDAPVGQIIFDPNGEYAYRNEQDLTSIYDEFPERCVRYTLRDNPAAGVRVLRGNFYSDMALAIQIIRTRYEDEVGRPPDYVRGFLEWEVLEPEEEGELQRDDPGAWTRYQRQKSIFQALLYRAGFPPPSGLHVDLHVNQNVRARLASELGVTSVPASGAIADAVGWYTAMWTRIPENDPLWQTSSGNAYFDDGARSMLTLLTGRRQGGTGALSGASKLISFRRFHSPDAAEILDQIAEAVDANQTVIIDLSNAAEDVVVFFSDLISRHVFQHQMSAFTENRLGDHYVQFYFEEAHVVFPRDDRDLKNIYNRLAKEGAKLHIGVVYSTQSIASLSRDLLKNTENFVIAHLNDQSEITELTKFHEFRDVGADVQRTKSRGFVRLITSSHKFALPVQVRLFAPREVEP